MIMKKILIPVDGSEYSNRALELGKKYVAALDGSIILMNVMDSAIPEGTYVIPSRFNYQQFAIDLEEQNARILEKAKNLLGDIPVETVSGTGSPAKRIAEYANENDVDLIIMGSHGQSSALQRFFVGSVTAKVLTLAKPPVLVVK
jgi:nucleotide-binding universal stress UspA family protein